VSRGAVIGDGAPFDPGDGGRVVAERSKGALAAVSEFSENVLVTEDAT
jgi:hypothetical protein